jgi:hypothetical protein
MLLLLYTGSGTAAGAITAGAGLGDEKKIPISFY